MRDKSFLERIGGFALIACGAVALVAAVRLLPMKSHADSSPYGALYGNFNITNSIAKGAAYIGAPTNVLGTNGFCNANGGYIGIGNYDTVTITVTGTNSATNVGNFVFSLVRSDKQSPPSVASDFETIPAGSYSAFTAPMNGQTAFRWQTNLDTYFAGGGTQWIGLYNVSNTASGGNAAVTVTVSGKIKPYRYP